MAQVGGEKGPKDWDLLELQVNAAINVGQVDGPDLNGNRLPLLKIFEWGRWQVKPEDIVLLKDSIQLASNLVRVGMPYIATFLPPRDDMFSDDDFFDENGERANLCPTEITVKQNPGQNEVTAAFKALEKLAPSIRWQTNYEMYSRTEGPEGKSMDWIGVTRLVDEERPWGVVEPEQIESADSESMAKDLDHRPLIIGIMGEYVNAIRDSPRNSEQHLRATFMAAITMAHEVGHAIFHQDFRSFNPPTLTEPYVGKGCHMELGIAFITWIFNGFHPNSTEMLHHSFVDFTSHLSWFQYYTMDMEKRPPYKTLYSISVNWIQRRLTQEWWDDLPSPQELINFSSEAREGLKPNTDSNSSEVATARQPEWIYSWATGRPEWKKDFGFRMPGYRFGDTVHDLSEEEIEWQKAQLPKHPGEGNLFDGLTERERRHGQRVVRQIQGEIVSDSDLDDEEDFFQAAKDEDEETFQLESEEHILSLGINDGMLDQNIYPPLEDDATPLTRIVVRYFPDGENNEDDDDDGNGYGGRSVKRPRFGPHDNDHSCSSRGQPKANVNVFLETHSPFTLSITMTRISLHEACEQIKIPSYATVYPYESWQQRHPDLEDREDMWAIQRYYNSRLDMAIQSRFEDDIQAILKLKKASLASVRHWGWLQLLDFCEANGVESHGSIENVVRRIRNWKHQEIEMVRHSGREDSPPSEEEEQEDDTTEKAAANPESWSVEELRIFCRQNDLPEVGTKTSLIVRAKIFLRERRNGGRLAHRHLELSRMDRNQFEVYVFKSILGQSTVAALKSALLVKGNFPPEAILTLYFNTDFKNPLQDDQPLSSYSYCDWETLRLKVARNSKLRPGCTAAAAIDVDAKPVVHFNDPIPLPGSTISSAIEVPDFPIITIDGEATPADILKAMKADPVVQREVAVVVNGATRTFSEMLSSVGDRALSLDRFVQAGGRFADRKNPQPATSGLSIMEEIEDHLEDEDNKGEILLALMEAPDPVPGKPEDRYPPLGRSHMADLFHAMSKKPVTPEEEEDE